MVFKEILLSDIEYVDILQDRDYQEIETSSSFIEFMRSIKSEGLLQPICVVPSTDGKYTILFGKRRFLASLQIAALDGKEDAKIPSIIIDKSIDENGTPVEVKILHENKHRENISRESYIESSIRLLPRFILKSNPLSLELGIDYIDDYILFSKDKSFHSSSSNIISLINGVKDFLESVHLKIQDIEEYRAMKGFDIEIRSIYYNGDIFFSSAKTLQELKNNNEEKFQSCLELISSSSSRQANGKTISSFSLSPTTSGADYALLYLKKRMKSISRLSKNIGVFDEEDIEKTKELFNEIELIFKKGQK